jgi:hypothetical protein
MAMLDVAMILMSSRLSGYMRNGGTPSLMAIAIRMRRIRLIQPKTEW